MDEKIQAADRTDTIARDTNETARMLEELVAIRDEAARARQDAEQANQLLNSINSRIGWLLFLALLPLILGACGVIFTLMGGIGMGL